MDTEQNGPKPELERLNYTELKDYVRSKGYDIALTQSANDIRAQVRTIESGEPEQDPEEQEVESSAYKVSGKFPKHPKIKEWLDAMANRYAIKLFEYTPKFAAFKLFRNETRKRDDNGKLIWQPDPDGTLRHFEWVSLRELAVTFGEADYPGVPKIVSPYQAPSKRKIQIKTFV